MYYIHFNGAAKLKLGNNRVNNSLPRFSIKHEHESKQKFSIINAVYN